MSWGEATHVFSIYYPLPFDEILSLGPQRTRLVLAYKEQKRRKSDEVRSRNNTPKRRIRVRMNARPEKDNDTRRGGEARTPL